MSAGAERDLQLRLVATVTRVLPDPGDHMPVLRALLAPPHDACPDPVYAARRTWLRRCRAWLCERGREPRVAQIRLCDQREYEAATGDIWQVTRTEVGK